MKRISDLLIAKLTKLTDTIEELQHDTDQLLHDLQQVKNEIVDDLTDDWAAWQIWTPGLPWVGLFYWSKVVQMYATLLLQQVRKAIMQVIARDLSDKRLCPSCPVAKTPPLPSD